MSIFSFSHGQPLAVLDATGIATPSEVLNSPMKKHYESVCLLCDCRSSENTYNAPSCCAHWSFRRRERAGSSYFLSTARQTTSFKQNLFFLNFASAPKLNMDRRFVNAEATVVWNEKNTVSVVACASVQSRLSVVTELKYYSEQDHTPGHLEINKALWARKWKTKNLYAPFLFYKM